MASAVPDLMWPTTQDSLQRYVQTEFDDHCAGLAFDRPHQAAFSMRNQRLPLAADPGPPAPQTAKTVEEPARRRERHAAQGDIAEKYRI